MPDVAEPHVAVVGAARGEARRRMRVSAAPRMRLVTLLLAATWGCGGRPALREWGDEAGTSDSGATDGGGLEGFCGGEPHLEVDGVVSPATVVGHAQWPAYSNEAADLVFTSTATTPGRLVVTWHAPAAAWPVAPASLDLAALPPGWDLAVYLDCSPGEPDCDHPRSLAVRGLTGTLRIDDAPLGYSLTLCLRYEDPGVDATPEVRTLHLWAAAVPASYEPAPAGVRRRDGRAGDRAWPAGWLRPHEVQ